MNDVEFEITKDVLSTDYEDEAVIVHLDSKRCFRLNDTAAAIWRCIAEGMSRDAMVTRLCERYDVDGPTAAREVDKIAEDLIERRLILRSVRTAGNPDEVTGAGSGESDG